MRTLSLVIAEAALETVPREVSTHPSVINYAKKVGANPQETLLDRSYHHAAMKSLRGAEKRGRPDIVHFALMEALSTPLFLTGRLAVYIHTGRDKVITVAPDLRVPKSYFRFEGLMMDLFRNKVVKTDEGKVLMELSDLNLEQLLKSTGTEKAIGLSEAGVSSTAERVAATFAFQETAFVIGGFPHGYFSEKTSRLFNHAYSINPLSLEAHVVIARVLYECEKRIVT